MRSKMISACLALVLVIVMFAGMDMRVSALAESFIVTDITYSSGTKAGDSIGYIHKNDAAPYVISFYYEDDAPELAALAGKTIVWEKSSIALSSNWSHSSAKSSDRIFELSIDDKEVAGRPGFYKVVGTLSSVTYVPSTNRIPEISIDPSGNPIILNVSGTLSTTYSPALSFSINDSFFTRTVDNNENSNSSDDTLPTPKIIIEAVRAFDKDSKPIDKITKDTNPFSLEITYSDYGVIWEAEHFDETRYEAYLTNAGGFNIPTTRGTLRRTKTLSTNDAPRFVVTFSNVTFKEGGTNTLSFDIFYDYYGDLITSSVPGVTIPMVDTKEEDDEITAPPATPHIILTQYSYGGEPITAGNDFMLNISYQNTSGEINLENIIMTVTPKSEHIVIAAASNTIYVNQLAAGSSLNHPIALAALPVASGSQNIDISFKYEYIIEKDSKTQERRLGDNTVSIAIPFIQVDRFTVDPIPENTDYIQVGDQFFISASFVNEGKSPIYNISATARGLNREIFSGVSRVEGTLQASANNELEIDIVCNEAGELMGEIVISYEDENMNRKEVVRPFTVYIEERYVPEMENPFPGHMDPGMMEDSNKLVISKNLVIPCVIGGLLIAAALARYVAKRVIAKEKEESNEDF